MDGLSEALGRFNSSKSEENPVPGDSDKVGKDEKSETTKGGEGHMFHIHKHDDGSHHLMVHGHHGQLVHHSEHESLEDAAEEMKKHGG